MVAAHPRSDGGDHGEVGHRGTHVDTGNVGTAEPADRGGERPQLGFAPRGVAAVALPGGGGSYAVCDVTGRVLEIAPSRPASLPLVVLRGAGAGEPGAPGTSLPRRDRLELAVAGAMPESMVPTTTAIAVGADGVVLGLRDKLEAIFGNAASLAQKFVSLATVLAHGDLEGVGAIDLRVPTAPVLLPQKSSPIVPGIVGG